MLIAKIIALAIADPGGGGAVTDQALARFEDKIRAVQSFLERPQKVAIADPWPKSPRGRLYTIAKIELISSAYDVQRTESLVSPYIAHLDLAVRHTANALCGDLRGPVGTVGWSLPANAVAAADRPECYGLPIRGGPYTLRFNYAFQSNQWVLKSVTIPDASHGESVLGISLGVSKDFPADPELGPFNAPWSIFINSTGSLSAARP